MKALLFLFLFALAARAEDATNPPPGGASAGGASVPASRGWGERPREPLVGPASQIAAGGGASVPASRSITRAEAEAIAQKNLKWSNLPANLDGFLLRLVDFEDEATMRRIKTDEPKLTLADRRLVNDCIAQEIHRRGGNIECVKINGDAYFAFLKQYQLTDVPGSTSRYIEWLRSGKPKDLPKTGFFRP